MMRLSALVLLTAGVARADRPAAPEMVEVPAGSYVQGTRRGEPDERPPHRVRLAAFRIDRREVTQAEYAACVKAGFCTAPRRYPGCVGDRLPVVGVSWHDAVAYCRWRGERLPSEAEWERAARGTDRRRFPWGDALECKRANFGNFIGAGPCAAENPGHVLPVGSRPEGASPVGALDMAGNVWEWTADRYLRYADAKPAGPPDHRVVRGGSCCSYFALPTTTNRLSFPASYRDRDIGFRCAR
jgi:formylglycine-generating enzyme required for sulfatase activity